MDIQVKEPQPRLRVGKRATIKSYTRAVERLVRFHNLLHPSEMEIDQVLDFVVYLKEKKMIQWRTNKIYVAGLRYYWHQILENPDFAARIPYPKEKPSLPKLLSREELLTLFQCCKNPKHRVIFRLMYGSGLRRTELLNLRINDIETKDNKNRIRINNSKGGKDRYTILPNVIIHELREYYIKCRPKVYLFNGSRKGQKLSEGGLRHALLAAKKRSGLKKEVNLHILRHCFASHALEEGMNIKTLQYLLGHTSVQTTMIYLHISEIPLTKAFSPLDKWSKVG